MTSKIQYQAVRQPLGKLDAVVIRPAEPQVEIAAAALFCHGFGAGGDDLVGLGAELLQIAGTEVGLAMAFPAAPIELDEYGMPGGRAWWLLSIQRLISALEEGRYEQVREEVPEGIDEARQLLVGAVEELLKECRLSEERLLLGGFSQGAMLSMDTTLRGLSKPPAGLCLFSGALICERQWKPQASKLASVSILQSHGRLDQILPLQTGLWLREFCEAAGSPIDFVEFNGPHTIPMESLEKAGKMLADIAHRPS